MPVDFDITRFHGSCIPQELFVTNWEAYKALRDIKSKKAAGPTVFIVSSSSFLPLNSRQLLPIFTTKRFVRASFLLSLRARQSTPPQGNPSQVHRGRCEANPSHMPARLSAGELYII